MAHPTNLGRFINECRKSLGYTSRQVATMSRTRPGLSGISHSNLIALEQGRHVPTYDKILTLALLYNVPTQLFEDHLKRDMLGSAAAHGSSDWKSLEAQVEKERLAGHYEAALPLYAELFGALQKADLSDTDRAARLGRARLQAANCRSRLGLSRVAKDELEELFKLENLPEDLLINAYFLLAETYRELGNPRLALVHAGTAVAQARSFGQPRLLAKTLNTLGNIHDDLGDHSQALSSYLEAQALLTELGDRSGAGRVLRNIGTTHERLKNNDQAVEAMSRGVQIARAENDCHGLVSGLTSLTRLYYLGGNKAQVRVCGKEAKELAQAESYTDLLFVSIFYLRRVAQDEQKASLARIYQDRLRAIRRKLEARIEEVIAFDEECELLRSSA